VPSVSFLSSSLFFASRLAWSFASTVFAENSGKTPPSVFRGVTRMELEDKLFDVAVELPLDSEEV